MNDNKILKNKVKHDRKKYASMENSVPQDGPQLYVWRTVIENNLYFSNLLI